MTLGSLTAVSIVLALPAQGCSIAGPPPLRVGLEEGLFDPGGGIYEQQTVAYAPPIVIRDAATASVVTRYWGRPPANLGLQFEGGRWFSWWPSNVRSSCEGILDDDGLHLLTPDGATGTLGYGFAPPPEDTEGPLSPEEAKAQGTVPWHRDAPSLALSDRSLHGPISEAELAILEAVYGPATVVRIKPGTSWRAALRVWWPTALGLVILAVVVGAAAYGVHRSQTRDSARTDPHQGASI